MSAAVSRMTKQLAKAFLVKGEKVDFNIGRSLLFGEKVYECEQVVKIRMDQITGFRVGNVTDANLCIILKDLLFSPLLKRTEENQEGASNDLNERELTVGFTFAKLTWEGAPVISINVGGPAIQELVFLFGDQGLRLTVVLSNLTIWRNEAKRPRMREGVSQFQTELAPQMVNDSFQFVGSRMGWYRQRYRGSSEAVPGTSQQEDAGAVQNEGSIQFVGELSIFVSAGKEYCDDPFRVNKKILSESYKCDMRVVAGNGRMIPCHKRIFSGQSDCLKQLVELELQHSDVLLLPDLNEPALRALMDFLYYWDFESPSYDFRIASELLQFAIKYRMELLILLLKKLFMNFPSEAIPMRIAFRIYLDASGNTALSQLRTKCISVLKLKRQELMNSYDYKMLTDGDARKLLEALEF